MDTTQIIDLVHSGGVSALAVIIWFELREQRKSTARELKAHRDEEAESRKVISTLSSLIERLLDRFDAEDATKKAQEAATKAQEAAQKAAEDAASRVQDFIREEISKVGERPLVGDDDDTPVEGVRPAPQKKRAQSNPYIYTKKPKDDKGER